MTIHMQIFASIIFCLIVLFPGGALGSGLLALWIKQREGASKIRFYNFLGRQVSAFAFILALLSALVFLAAYTLMFMSLEVKAPALPSLDPARSPVGAIIAGVIITLVFGLAFFWSRFMFGRNDAAVPSQALSAGTALFAGVSASYFCLRAFFFFAPALLPDLGTLGSIGEFLQTAYRFNAVTPFVYLYFAASVVALAIAMNLCMLIVRRNRDDYGRDYYNFALSRLGSWSMLFCLLALLALTGIFVVLYGVNAAEITADNIMAGVKEVIADIILLAVSTFIYYKLKKSPNPMRNKPGIAVGMIFMLAVSCRALFLIIAMH